MISWGNMKHGLGSASATLHQPFLRSCWNNHYPMVTAFDHTERAGASADCFIRAYVPSFRRPTETLPSFRASGLDLAARPRERHCAQRDPAVLALMVGRVGSPAWLHPPPDQASAMRYQAVEHPMSNRSMPLTLGARMDARARRAANTASDGRRANALSRSRSPGRDAGVAADTLQAAFATRQFRQVALGCVAAARCIRAVARGKIVLNSSRLAQDHRSPASLLGATLLLNVRQAPCARIMVVTPFCTADSPGAPAIRRFSLGHTICWFGVASQLGPTSGWVASGSAASAAATAAQCRAASRSAVAPDRSYGAHLDHTRKRTSGREFLPGRASLTSRMANPISISREI